MATARKPLVFNVIRWLLMLGVILLILILSFPARSQLLNDMSDESKLYAESKQVNQFFRRFNGEEDEKGNRYYPSDKPYRSIKLRKKYLGVLFDEHNPGLNPALKKEFAEQILDKSEASILDFHGTNWFAEVDALFKVNGVDQPMTLYMELEKNHLGYKWVVRRVYADVFAPYFTRDTAKVGRFIHPLSHELDFMNLRKAFAQRDSVSQFAAKTFTPDHLSLFLYEMKKGNLKFTSVQDVTFHFFQIDGWYFQLSHFNRPDYNAGWLISSLVKLKNDSEKDLLKRYLYNETK